ncbi:LTA synthase family protein [Aureivirga marina]|uniref:LTA synthase family protein n=1 Tax=Aureivirga marina TaxID=1182451 RepID=UPI0018C9A19C|nr:sulfatase-like hydrolase/transferase [Aureivirga marina]
MNLFIKSTLKLAKYFLFLVGITFAMRFTFLLRFGDFSLFKTNFLDILHAFQVGFLFDTQTLLYILSPLLLFFSFAGFVTFEKREKFIDKFSRIYLGIFIPVLVFLLICDHQFYSFFQEHLNLLAFGILEDDTIAVLTSMWTDHPVLRILLTILIFVLINNKVLQSIFHNFNTTKEYEKKIQYAFPVLLIVFVFLGFRGSIKEFPLQERSASVSKNSFINKIPLHGVYTLMKAAGEKDDERIKIDEKDFLIQKGYQTLEEVYAAKKNLDIPTKISKQDIFFNKTEKNTFLEENKPNVIFFLMEGMSNHYLSFENENLNLTGALKKHLEEDILFQNFLPAQNGTIYSIECIAFNVVQPPITSTSQRFKTYESSIAYPFKQANYTTKYISGGSIGWRSLDDMLIRNYFDVAYGKSGILENVKDAEENDTWGVHDQYLFDDVFLNLEKTSVPQFIFAQTMTNHTPYEMPDDYQPFSLELNNEIRNLVNKPEDETKLCFKAYQYANHQLGLFLDKLKKSKYAENTIVIATGDHNMKNLINYDLLNDPLKKLGVPLYMYIPEKYKENLTINTERFGSHKDMFPTIFNLCLSDVEYFDAGNNLFTKDSTTLFYGKNENLVLHGKATEKENVLKHKKAEETLIEYYFNERY